MYTDFERRPAPGIDATLRVASPDARDRSGADRGAWLVPVRSGYRARVARVLMDRYVLSEVIGAGGAAKVYRATDRGLDRQVAVKLLDDSVARSADPGGRDRFVHEARSAARFDHPHLVTVYDAGEDDGDLFLVMELVDGRTLADVIAERGPLPVDESVSVAMQILDGLATVHAMGTIHRDIKPSNVLIDGDGRVRLTDFGIAKRLDDIEAAVTAAGMLVGTPHYLAPEQATGQPLSPATDVYQVGLVLHEMLTGRRAGGSSPALAAKAQPVDPRHLRPETPEQVADAIVQSTQRDPAKRFDSAQAMMQALAGGEPAPSPLVAAGAVAASAVVAGGTPRLTMAMPANGLDDATSAIDPAAWRGGGAAPTVVVPAAASPPVGRRRMATPNMPSRGRLVGWGLGAGLLLLLFALAIGDRGESGNLVPGDSTVPSETTTPAMVLTTTPATIVTTPPTVPPTTAPPVEEDDEGRGRGNGKGNGKKNDDD